MDFSNTKINKVGDIIRTRQIDNEYYSALRILNSWRESHGAILNGYYAKCQRLARRQNGNVIVAQRLKRLPTIIDKLDRQPKMRLSSMQDVAGVRIIVRDMKMLQSVRRRLLKWRYLDSVKDYLAYPKQDGYRGMHFIFKKNNKRVEIQLRTELQHLWATSVESTDFFRGTALKTRGDNSYWGRFFILISSAFAIAEKTTQVPTLGLMNYEETLYEIKKIISERNIIDSLRSMAFVEVISKDIRFRKSRYILMDLDHKAKKCNVICFKSSSYKLANEKYEELEAKNYKSHNVVLVAVNGFNKLKDAYPNYFIDISKFIEIIVFMLELNEKEDII